MSTPKPENQNQQQSERKQNQPEPGQRNRQQRSEHDKNQQPQTEDKSEQQHTYETSRVSKDETLASSGQRVLRGNAYEAENEITTRTRPGAKPDDRTFVERRRVIHRNDFDGSRGDGQYHPKTSQITKDDLEIHERETDLRALSGREDLQVHLQELPQQAHSANDASDLRSRTQTQEVRNDRGHARPHSPVQIGSTVISTEKGATDSTGHLVPQTPRRQIQLRGESTGRDDLRVRGPNDLSDRVKHSRRHNEPNQFPVHGSHSNFPFRQNDPRDRGLHIDRDSSDLHRQLDRAETHREAFHEQDRAILCGLLEAPSSVQSTVPPPASGAAPRGPASARRHHQDYNAHDGERPGGIPGRWSESQVATRRSPASSKQPLDELEKLWVKDEKREYDPKRMATPWVLFNKNAVRCAPIYAPSVEPMKLRELVEFGFSVLAPEDSVIRHAQFTITFVTDPSFANFPETAKFCNTSPLSSTELTILKDSGLIHECAPTSTPTVFAFLTPEEKRGALRKRTIFHTQVYNDHAMKAHQDIMKINSVNLLSSRVRRSRVAASRDFKSYYHQFLLHPSVSRLFIFTTRTKEGIRSFNLTRAAMGNKNSAAAASAITRLLVKLAITVSGAENILYDIVIDDILFLAQDTANLLRVLAAFDSLCERFSVTIGTKTEDVTGDIVHRGIVFALHRKTQRLKPEFLHKFKLRCDFFIKKQTFERARSILGMIAYAGQVIYIPTFSTAFRAYAMALANSDPRLLVPTWLSTFQTVVDNTPKPLEMAENVPFGGVVVSDATLTRIASTFVDAFGTIREFAQDISPETINIQEARASLEGLRLASNFPTPHRVHIIGDNLTWLYAVQPNRVTTPELEIVRQQFWGMIGEKNILPTFLYVPSKKNYCDAMSRNEQNTITILDTMSHAKPIFAKGKGEV